MIKKVNALGDRLLALLLPSSTADAAANCQGQFLYTDGDGCNFYCYRWGDRSSKLKWCSKNPTCRVVCYECC
ncbi:hypothetical protein OUY22_29990 [Nonomuraea sp. MCN248]|uniref:Secreted protein n=1 Tax=Nonomuraea corallina TaxID=2989783 RepID=A0ABT4SKA5_9ACTN|nr:hypothetical protein [Nonomuraea corallina]MDA0637659.1 hypothetical protein [Nonomuraea corallina]